MLTEVDPSRENTTARVSVNLFAGPGSIWSYKYEYTALANSHARTHARSGGEEKERVELPPHKEPYVNGITRGQLCAFMVGIAPFVLEAQVAAESVAHFMPGMRIAIAAHAEDVSLFER